MICFANRLTGFFMVLIFAEKCFHADYKVAIVLYKYFVDLLKLLSAVIIVVLSKSLVYLYYIVDN